MRLVVLDAHALNPGDLCWEEFQALGDVVVHPRTAPGETLARAAGAEAVLTNKVELRREHFAALPRLRYVGILATGANIVDLAAARERGVTVTNVPAYSTMSVAQLVFALLLELALGAGHHSRTVREGRWSACPDFSYFDFPLVELAGLTFGVVGYGRIGQAVAGIARAFGMRVLVHTRTRPDIPPAHVRFTPLEELLPASDVVSLHCPLTPETRHLLDARRLALLRPTAYVINTGRGPLVDEAALADALNAGRLAGAGLDVLATEPPPPDHPLLTARNCLITPHLGWTTTAARRRLMRVAFENLRDFLAGRPRNVIN